MEVFESTLAAKRNCRDGDSSLRLDNTWWTPQDLDNLPLLPRELGPLGNEIDHYSCSSC